MIDAEDFEATETLKNGLTVKIRAIRPADKPGIVEAFRKLDPVLPGQGVTVGPGSESGHRD